MLAPPQYRRTYSNTAMRNIDGRKEYYDKHRQFISITFYPVSSHKLPLLVKFPHTTSYFRRMGTDSLYCNNSEGLFNGVYFIPMKYNKGSLPIHDTCSISNYGYHMDMRDWVNGTRKYTILKTAYENVSRNVYITSQRQVHMKKVEMLHNFRTDDELNTNGKFYLKSNHF